MKIKIKLNSFEYDIQKDAMVKINDRYEFPESIDLTRFLESPDPEVKKKKKILQKTSIIINKI